jgi:hypothetical protein
MIIGYCNDDEINAGVCISLTGPEVAEAVKEWVVKQNVQITGQSSVILNGKICDGAVLVVHPTGKVVAGEQVFFGEDYTI